MTAEQMTAFELHLNFCDGCFRFVDQVRATAALAGALPEEADPGRAEDQAAHGLQGLEARMKAYKFLTADGLGVFSRFAWPLPDGGPGAWIEAEVEPCRVGSTPAGRPTSPTGLRPRCSRSSSTALSTSTHSRWSRPAGG